VRQGRLSTADAELPSKALLPLSCPRPDGMTFPIGIRNRSDTCAVVGWIHAIGTVSSLHSHTADKAALSASAFSATPARKSSIGVPSSPHPRLPSHKQLALPSLTRGLSFGHTTKFKTGEVVHFDIATPCWQMQELLILMSAWPTPFRTSIGRSRLRRSCPGL